MEEQNPTQQDNPTQLQPAPESAQPRYSVREIVRTLLVLTVAAVVFFSGYGLGVTQAGGFGLSQIASTEGIPFVSDPTATCAADPTYELFFTVWDRVEQSYYYDLPSEEERVYGAIDGLVNSLDDPHSGFVDPESADLLRERFAGSFEGIGAVVETGPNGGVYIIRVFTGSPAETAGIRAGDIIVTADGVDLISLTLEEGVNLIRGEAGTQVRLEVFREGEEELLSFDVTRARIEFPSVEYRMLENNIGYVALYDFYSASAPKTREALQNLISDGAEAIIFDLRGNGGGYLDSAVDIADFYLGDGLVLIQRSSDGTERSYESRNGGIAEDIPLVVLIDGNSASASEIVAGAIQDRGRGTIIGVVSFGKGSVQTLYDLENGSILRLTTANWYTPNDRSISAEGITPDILVEFPADGLLPGEDPQLERAIEFLLSGR